MQQWCKNLSRITMPGHFAQPGPWLHLGQGSIGVVYQETCCILEPFSTRENGQDTWVSHFFTNNANMTIAPLFLFDGHHQ